MSFLIVRTLIKIFPADVDALLHDKKRAGVYLPQGVPQVFNFVLVHAHAEDMGVLAGIRASFTMS